MSRTGAPDGGRRSRLVGLAAWLGLAGAAGAAAGALLAPFHHLFDLVAMFAAPALSAAVLAGGLALLLRRRAMAAAFGLCAAVLLLHVTPQFFPALPKPAPGARPVTIYFANVWARNRDNAAIARSVKAADADVVAMTEIADQHAPALPEILSAYPYRTSTDPARNFEGGPRTVIASRFPIERSALSLQDGLAVGEVTIRGPDGPFRFMAVHLTRPWPLDGRVRAQRDQTIRLARRIHAGESQRLVLVGDFNATAASAILRRFSREAGLVNAPARMGTWFDPLPGPLAIAIDNAFVGPAMTVTRRRVGPANGSDHRPILITVAAAGP
ncbi:MAG: endonuclease/exonuclease/phosphatase family protein [Caulobacteraceae bacterium]|nr:endonuclease/exonuclease/phosphatase family protein [Caulobacteraceae bacterium]